MSLVLNTNAMAWMGATLLIAQAALGLIRVNRRSFRKLHIVLGTVLLPVTFAHAWVSMRMLPARFAGAFGLQLASAALLLLIFQFLTGTALARPSEHSRLFGKVHLGVAVGIVCLAGVHVLLTRY